MAMAVLRDKGNDPLNQTRAVVPISLANMFNENKEDHFYEFTPAQLNQATSESQQAFSVIYQGTFTLEKKAGINLLISASSDFLRLDVSFVLINTQSQHMYSPQTYTEDKKKLLIQDAPEGQYKLYVYARKCD